MHILGSTSEILILGLGSGHLTFCITFQGIPRPGRSAWGTAVSPGPSMVAQNTEGLEETHSDHQPGSDSQGLSP